MFVNFTLLILIANRFVIDMPIILYFFIPYKNWLFLDSFSPLRMSFLVTYFVKFSFTKLKIVLSSLAFSWWPLREVLWYFRRLLLFHDLPIFISCCIFSVQIGETLNCLISILADLKSDNKIVEDYVRLMLIHV